MNLLFSHPQSHLNPIHNKDLGCIKQEHDCDWLLIYNTELKNNISNCYLFIMSKLFYFFIYRSKLRPSCCCPFSMAANPSLFSIEFNTSPKSVSDESELPLALLL